MLFDWLFFDATFKGGSKDECYGDGACWIFINVWFEKFIYGLYPVDQIWRINLAFLILIFSVITAIFVGPKIKKYIIIFLLFIFPFLATWLMGGFAIDIESLEIYIPILEEVDTRVWGGLSLTFIMAIFAMLLCFPLGIFLALGRRSSLPVIRYSSIGFIEFWRGVPLITVLFMASVMFPMFLPADTYVDKLFRCIIGITLFEAAYNGLPLVTITWGGQMDFICKPNKKGKRVPHVARVDYNLEPVPRDILWPGVIVEGSEWAVAKEASYKRAIRDILTKETHHKLPSCFSFFFLPYKIALK